MNAMSMITPIWNMRAVVSNISVASGQRPR